MINNKEFALSQSEQLKMILNIVDETRKNSNVFPPKQDVFKALKLTPIEETRVVILGQDPYHEEGQANGLAFSVHNGVTMPPSLRNIFKELQSDIGGPLRTNTDLSDWAEQGVMLLNTALTVVEAQPNSMTELWEKFTDNLIKYINLKEEPVVFVLWGNNARKKKQYIDLDKHFVIESAHPSPLSANRGFFGSKPFSKINNILINNHSSAINWLNN